MKVLFLKYLMARSLISLLGYIHTCIVTLGLVHKTCHLWSYLFSILEGNSITKHLQDVCILKHEIILKINVYMQVRTLSITCVF